MFLTATVVAAALGGCNQQASDVSQALDAAQAADPNGIAMVASVRLVPSQAVLAVGDMIQMTANATVEGIESQAASDSLAWHSSDARVAEVSASGRVTARAQGSCQVGVTYAGVTAAAATIRVSAPAGTPLHDPAEADEPSELEVVPHAKALAVGEQAAFAAHELYPDGTTGSPLSQVTWMATNPNVLSIDANGLAVGRAVGQAQVLARVGTRTSSAAVVAVSHGALVSVTLAAPSPTLVVDTTQMLTASVTWADGATEAAQAGQLSFTSSDNALLSVAANGQVRGLRTGSATVTASFGAVTSSPVAISVAPALTTFDTFATGNENFSTGQGKWQLSFGGANSDGSAQLTFNTAGRSTYAMKLAYQLDSGAWGYASATGSSIQENNLSDGGFSRIQFAARGSGALPIKVCLNSTLANSSNDYGRYCLGLGAPQSTWTDYDAVLASFTWAGTIPHQTYTLDDALAHNNGLVWVYEGGNGASGVLEVDDIVLLQSEAANPYPWALAWGDEFDVDGAPNPMRWTYDLGDGCPDNCQWGNNELQYYTSRAENVVVDGGLLKIRALAENMGGYGYTSARLVTRGLRSFTYGRFEARIKTPTAAGVWPAFWLLAADQTHGTWPASGELDIFEYVPAFPGQVRATVHNANHNHRDGTDLSGSIASPTLASDFHIYRLDWTPAAVVAYFDGFAYFIYKNDNLGAAGWPYDSPFYLILNLAVGGAGGGTPGPAWPNELDVDWVRVYQ